MGNSPHRRTGSAVFEFIHQIGWTPSELFLAGVGISADDAIRAKEMWPEIEIVGFEPNPASFQSLQGKFPGLLFNEALSEKKGTAQLHYRHNWKNGSSLYPPKDGVGSVKEVATTSLDQVLALGNSLLWLDVEGSELQVLHGAEDFIKGVKAVNIEMTGRPRTDGWAKPLEVHNWLTSHGFYQSYVHTIRTVISQFDAVYLHRDIFKPNMCSCLDALALWEFDKRKEATC